MQSESTVLFNTSHTQSNKQFGVFLPDPLSYIYVLLHLLSLNLLAYCLSAGKLSQTAPAATIMSFL